MGQSVMMRNDGTILAGQNTGAFQRLATEEFVLMVFNQHQHDYIPGDNTPTQTGVPTMLVPSDSTTSLTATIKGN
jgi:hypothetical protein